MLALLSRGNNDGLFLKAEPMVSSGPLSAASSCFLCYRIGLILRKGLKEEDVALVNSEKVIDLYINDFCSFDPISRPYNDPLNLGFALCS